jgi:hypothetical protein
MLSTLILPALLVFTPLVFLIVLVVGAFVGRRTEGAFRRRLVQAALDREGVTTVRVEADPTPGGFEIDNTVRPPHLRLVDTR